MINTYTKKQIHLSQSLGDIICLTFALGLDLIECKLGERKQGRQVMQNTHEFVLNNCIKCYCICCVTLGSKRIEQAQL